MRELVAEGEVTVQRVSTADNVADLLTKSLPYDAFVKHTACVSGDAVWAYPTEGGASMPREGGVGVRP